MKRGAVRPLQQRAGLDAGPRGPPSGQQLERDCRERKNVGGRAPGAPRDPFGGGVGPPDRRPDPHLFERFDNAEAGGPGFVGRDEDVARMQAPVADARGAREVDRAGQLRDERQRLLDRRRRVVAHRHVERLRRHVLLRAVGQRPLDPGGNRLDDGGMKERRLGGAGQRVGEQLRLFGNDVEAEHLDRDQAVARRLIRSKNGTKGANTDLMQHPEGAECWRRRESAWVLSGQRRYSSGRSSECSTNYGILGAFRRVTSEVPSCASLTALEPL